MRRRVPSPLRSRWCAAGVCLALGSCTGSAAQRPAPEARQNSLTEAAPVQAPQAPKPAAAKPPPARESPAPATKPRSIALDWRKELANLPENVLVGTDVTPLSDFMNTIQEIPSSGSFSSEQGGANASVKLDGQTLTREFAEPGSKPQLKRYDGLQRHADSMRASGQGVELIGVKEGILVLEKNSGVEGIPNSLWIEYEARKP